jgi:DNA modification methylase
MPVHISSIAAKKKATTPAYTTGLGRMYHGRSETLLSSKVLASVRGRVQLVFTSPPFALNRKKKYGNEDGQQYVDWLAGFAVRLKEYLTPTGSIVIELGNGWVPGSPTMSTLALEALLKFKKVADLHLCQEFICYNPARLPSPAEWVTVERIRVKDAFTRVWWLSPTERPKADNRRVLTEYSASMKSLLARGTYNPGRRPSEHNIGRTSFLSNNGGAIVPNVLMLSRLDEEDEANNLLAFSNTNANDAYLAACRKSGVGPHPARMQAKLVEFFVKFLTEPGDLILDPFAGSNTTGFVADTLRRRWVSIEALEDYVEASRSRFPKAIRKTR